MKKYNILILFALISLFTTSLHNVRAASTPSLSLSLIGTNLIQATITNADPNAPVILFYPSNSGYSSVNIGLTNSSGNLSTNFSSGTYGINPGVSVYVNVDGQPSSSSVWPNYTTNVTAGILSLSQNTVTVPAGQSTVITSSISTNVTITNNTNSTVASATIAGNQVIIYGYNAGVTNITLCASTSGCSTIAVSVTGSTGTSNLPGISLSQNSINLNVGQTQSITISGPGGYNLTSNSSPSVVSAALNNSNLNITGLAFGSSNINICQQSNSSQCANLYVYVSNIANQAVNQTPALSSLTISSNNLNNGFADAGDLLTLTFSFDQIVTNPTLNIGGSNITLSGSGTGPYSGTYTVSGSESKPLTATISFSNSAGITTQSFFSIGMPNAQTASTVTTSLTTTPVSTNTISATTNSTFQRFLGSGSTGADVSALQQRLKSDGLYTGPITGTYGPLTVAAVKKYQAKNKLSQLGIVGPSTRALLNQGI